MLVDQATQSLILHHDDPFELRSLLEHSRLLDHPEWNVAVHHTLEATKVLRNLGINAPAPIRFQYDWPGKFTPFKHQIVMSEFLTLHRRGFNLSDMGSGKTNSALWAADWLMTHGRVEKVLVLAPLSTLDRVWALDIFDTLMHRKCVIVHGGRDKREAALAADVDFYIMNHDGLRTEAADQIFRRPDINLVIVDEASMFRNHQTNKYKALAKLVSRHDMRLWLMTGTPCPNDPTDAWALAKLVSPERVPKYFGGFKRATMLQVSQFKWVPKTDAFTTAYDAMQPATRFKKADCLDLPPVTTQDRQVQLSSEQRKAFEAMRLTMVAEAKAKTVNAVNAADKIGKLRQILCIGKDTPVLTHRGWVPIQQVRVDDFAWDGVEWVAHGGLVEKGVQPVVECHGVRMTPDHLVRTHAGWRSAQEILDAKGGGGLERQSVRLPHGDPPRRLIPHQEGSLALSVRLWSRGASAEPELTRQSTSQRQPLRLSSQIDQPYARHVVRTALPHLDTYDPALSRPRVQGLQELGCTRDFGVQQVATVVPAILGGYATGVLGSADDRSDQQQRQLRAGQLPVGDGSAASQQHTQQSLARHTEGTLEPRASGQGLPNVTSETALATKSLAADRRADTTVTYDIRDCGPRNRFVVRDKWGAPLIVHNCGAIKVGDDEYITYDHKPRLDVLLETIGEASAKVIVVVPFKGIMRALQKELEEYYTVGMLNGDVSPGARNIIIKEFKEQADPHILLCHPKVMAHGLNLTEADTLVFYAPIYSNDEFQQVSDRFNRAGQTKKMTIIRMGGHALEWNMFALLDARMSSQSSILDLYRAITE